MSYSSKRVYDTLRDVPPSDAVGIVELTHALAASADRFEKLETQQEVLHNDLHGIRKLYGADGFTSSTAKRADYEAIGSFVKAVVGRRLGHADLEKVAAPWSIDVDARGGILVPPQVASYIDALLRPEGSLLARTTFHQVEPGRDFRVPYYATAPVAGWQDGENADLAELDIVIAARDIKPVAVGGFLDVSWQLMHQSAFDVGRAVVAEAYEATRQAWETALVQGEGGVDAPFDGLLHAAGNTQTALATMTSALVSLFIHESITDAPSLAVDGVIGLHPTCFEALAASDASSNYTGRLGRGSDGLPMFGTYPVVRTPAVPVTSIVMYSPRHVHSVSFGNSLIVDDKSGAKSLTIRIVPVTWAGYSVSLAAAVSKATVTNVV